MSKAPVEHTRCISLQNQNFRLPKLQLQGFAGALHTLFVQLSAEDSLNSTKWNICGTPSCINVSLSKMSLLEAVTLKLDSYPPTEFILHFYALFK